MKQVISGCLLTLLIVLANGALWAAETEAIQNKVWGEYLSPAEQAALLEMMAGAAGGEVGFGDIDQEARLKVMRESFAKFAAWSAPPPRNVSRRQFDENGLRGLWFEPKAADPNRVLLYFHGGGYAGGSPMTAAAVAGYLAQEAKVRCFSLDYPLAPEAPYPAAVDSALAAYRMLLDTGLKAENIVLAGDSSGGGLALATLLNIRDQGLPRPAGALLFSPWADLSHSRPSISVKKEVDLSIVNLELLQWLASLYAAGEDLKTPLISPAFADLRGLPPLFIQVGSHEILLDDALTIARNAGLADVPVSLTVWPGYFHVFQMFNGKLEGGRKALHDGAEFINAVTGKTLLRTRADEMMGQYRALAVDFIEETKGWPPDEYAIHHYRILPGVPLALFNVIRHDAREEMRRLSKEHDGGIQGIHPTGELQVMVHTEEMRAFADYDEFKRIWQEHQAKRAEDDFVIVQPRGNPFHGDEGPKPGLKEGWLALIKKDGDWYLEKTSMQVKPVRDLLLDADDDPPTGLEISSRKHPEALVLIKHPSLKAGKINVPEQGAWQIEIAERKEDDSEPRLLTSFKFNGHIYWLEIFKNIYGISPEYLYSDAYDTVDKLYLHTARPEKPSMLIPQPKKKILWGNSAKSMHSTMETHSTIQSIWVGDLDQDGLPDLIIWNSGYNHSGVCLYLSSISAPGVDGALPGRAGCQIGVGC